MHLLGKITVTAVIPEPLKKLEDIAYNLWWSWNSDCLDLFRDIDNILWIKVQENPAKFLQEVNSSRLEAAMKNPGFMGKYIKITESYESYINSKNTWFALNHSDKQSHIIAYFSAEYGLSDVLPIYNGSLGIHSGDCLKSAGDLGIPLVGIGLLYKEGCINRQMNRDGWQETHYSGLNFFRLPIKPARDSSDSEITIKVELSGKEVYAKVWEVKAGRVSLYLLDTDICCNMPEDRHITSRVYIEDPETRLKQDILLGIGGVRALDALGIHPAVCHMNEGHTAFLCLEVIRKLVQESSLTFREAQEVIASSTVFTAHTPVPGGCDIFPLYLIEKYFNDFWDSCGISRYEFFDLGMKSGEGTYDFSMTVLAIKLSGYRSGVSELHGAVLRNFYKSLWPGVPEEEIPIYHITSGIHTKSWLAPEIGDLFVKYTGINRENGIPEKEMWDQISSIPDEVLWETHKTLKHKALISVSSKLKSQTGTKGSSPDAIINQSEDIPSPEILTIGFARSITSYKRTALIFRNIERIKNILNNPSMPVQIIFAGNAHTADHAGQEIIKNISDIARQEGFKGKVFLLENYNIQLARTLVKGCDIWLNNSRRPLETGGTGGQKAGLNGVLNLSVKDGWWAEGYHPNIGWVIDSDSFYDNEELQDNADNESLLALLENEVIPLYYSRNEKGIPEVWVRMMKESIKTVGYQFSSCRMTRDYFEKFYYPCIKKMDNVLKSNYKQVRDMAAWRNNIEKHWRKVSISSVKCQPDIDKEVIKSNQFLSLTAVVHIEDIDPSDIKLEVYYGKEDRSGLIENYETAVMSIKEAIDAHSYLFTASLSFVDGGEYAFTIRAMPYHPGLINDFDLKLIRWAI